MHTFSCFQGQSSTEAQQHTWSNSAIEKPFMIHCWSSLYHTIQRWHTQACQCSRNSYFGGEAAEEGHMLLTTKAWHGTTVVCASSLLSAHESHRELLLHVQCKGKSKFPYGTGNSLPRTARVRQWWNGREEEAVRMAVMMVKSRRQAYHAWGPPSGSNGDCLVSLMVSEPIKTKPDTIPSEQSCQSQIQEALWGEHQLQSSCWETACSGLMLVAFHAVRPLYDQISCLTLTYITQQWILKVRLIPWGRVNHTVDLILASENKFSH